LRYGVSDDPQFRERRFMTAVALYGLVLFSAIAHAVWNSLVKSAGDRTLTMVTIRLTGLVLALLALPFVDWPERESWKWLALTAIVQFGYYVLLVRSYGLGDMSVVYPLARGIAPVLMTIVAFVSLGEALSPAHVVAVGLISFGIMVLSLGAGASRLAVGYACATGVAVAAYSFFGGLGVRTAGTVLGFQVCLELVTGRGVVSYAFIMRGKETIAYVRRHGGVGFFAGTMSVLGYLAFLAAAKSLPLGPVVALRETSVIFGTLIGTFVLKEAFGIRRVAASTFVIAGIAMLALVR
jgi:drug/metabolite transporter (DMT)-like permease